MILLKLANITILALRQLQNLQNKLFQNECFNPSQCRRQLHSHLKQLGPLHNKTKKKAQTFPIRIKRHPPPLGFFKLNIEGAPPSTQSASGIGGILKR